MHGINQFEWKLENQIFLSSLGLGVKLIEFKI